MGYHKVNGGIDKIAVKMVETEGTPCVIASLDKLSRMEWAGKWLQWAAKPVSWLLTWLGLNTDELMEGLGAETLT